MGDQFDFQNLAEEILAMPVVYRANRLGGYGKNGEVIFEGHPSAWPSTLVDHQGPATVTFQTNGSLDFEIETDQRLVVHVLEGSFDPVEKREISVLSSNVWLDLISHGDHHITSLINPSVHWNLPAKWIKLIKLGGQRRSMWYCAGLNPGQQGLVHSAVRLRLVSFDQGPVLAREIYLKNCGEYPVEGNLWTYYNLHGTQRFVYHKQLWYDAGMPVGSFDTVNFARIPHEKVFQVKRVSSHTFGLEPAGSTCDYTSFIGDTGASIFLPAAIMRGNFLDTGAGESYSRFATASISASRFTFRLEPGEPAVLLQSLQYITDPSLIDRFLEQSSTADSSYTSISRSFRQAAQNLVAQTPGADQLSVGQFSSQQKNVDPPFEVDFTEEPAVAAYINSAWVGVQELYEKCRGHGARMADGIELGTRDRAQDMLAKMKEDPRQVRQDLLHAFGFMYMTRGITPDSNRPLELHHKLYGMFPRQFPSRWILRDQPVHNDNRPYADSPLWLIQALAMYIRETGDFHILLNEVTTIRLVDEDHPETSAIIDNSLRLQVIDVVTEIFSSYQRHVDDSPYHLAQVLFGDWCDPVDMMGTSVVGDPLTRGIGRGIQLRLSAHLFLCLVDMIDILEIPTIQASMAKPALRVSIAGWKRMADKLRKSIVKWGWEDEHTVSHPGFIDCMHELEADGSRPDYDNHETGYTLGSMRGSDFDGIPRRILTTQAYCLEMLRVDRPYLEPTVNSQQMIQQLLNTVNQLFFQPKLGLMLFSTSVANTPRAVSLIGRLGIVPPGCAENGEYHHAQMFMHYYRLNIPGQADQVWQQFKPVLSVTRDETIGGPFDMTSNSFVADPQDPHYGKGMYFGLSGSIDWMVEVFQKIAGVELAMHDPSVPDVSIQPRLPTQLENGFTFKRIIHKSLPDGSYHSVPLAINIKRHGSGPTFKSTEVHVNGKPQSEAVIWNVADYEHLMVEITYVYD